MKIQMVNYLFVFILLSGCVYLKYADKLFVLKGMGDNRRQIKKYLDEQDKLFGVLKEDIKSDRLRKGMLKREVLKLYGEPVLSEEVTADSLVKEAFLYRHPTDYFSSDRVYLYFDNSETLLYWEYIPYK